MGGGRKSHQTSHAVVTRAEPITLVALTNSADLTLPYCEVSDACIVEGILREFAGGATRSFPLFADRF
jgi:hypothetical protein